MAVFKTEKASETYQLGKAFGQILRLGKAPAVVAELKASSAATSIIYSIIARRGVRSRAGPVLGLMGDLGTGKTTFVKGLARGLGVRERITSPTYVFARSYKIPPFKIGRQAKDKFYHLDLYRLDGADRKILASFEFEEIIRDPAAIVAIEWAERLSLKAKSISIYFNYDNSGRSIRID